MLLWLLSPRWTFQSTPPRGRRLSVMNHALKGYRFNPRLREGGDRLSGSCTPRLWRFNPRLREGGDTAPTAEASQLWGFNPRLREGGDKNSHPPNPQS